MYSQRTLTVSPNAKRTSNEIAFLGMPSSSRSRSHSSFPVPRSGTSTSTGLLAIADSRIACKVDVIAIFFVRQDGQDVEDGGPVENAHVCNEIGPITNADADRCSIRFGVGSEK